MSTIYAVDKATTNEISAKVTSTRAPSITDSLFRDLKQGQPKRRSTRSVYTSTLDNLTKQSKVNLTGTKPTSSNMQQQETIEYKGVGAPLNMNAMINPLQVLQNTINTQNAQMMAMGGMMSGMSMGGGVPPMYDMSGSGGTISLAQAESLLQVNTGRNKFQGGGSGFLTPEVRREMATYLQRYIAEGAARGVDVLAMLKAKGGVKVGLANWSGNGIGVGGGGSFLFRKSWWDSASPGKRMGLFFQEFSHALGFMMDSQNARYGFERGWMHGAVDASNPDVYRKNFDMLFQDMRTYGGKRDNLKLITMNPLGGGMGAPTNVGTAMPGSNAAGNPYGDLMNGFLQGFNATSGMGGQGVPGAAPQPQQVIVQPPTITPPAPIPTLGNPTNGMQPMQGLHSPHTAQPGGGGTTLGLDTSPYSNQSFSDSGGMNSDIGQTTGAFAAELSTIPTQSVPMLQGLAGALLGA